MGKKKKKKVFNTGHALMDAALKAMSEYCDENLWSGVGVVIIIPSDKAKLDETMLEVLVANPANQLNQKSISELMAKALLKASDLMLAITDDAQELPRGNFWRAERGDEVYIIFQPYDTEWEALIEMRGMAQFTMF